MVEASGGQRFPRCYRIRKNDEFRAVYGRKARASDQRLLVYVCENQLGHPRLGLSVSRKVGNAVVRNRWKRLIREAFRLNVARLPEGVDLVVIPKAGPPPPFRDIANSLCSVARHAARRLASPHGSGSRGSKSSGKQRGNSGPSPKRGSS